MANLNYYNPIKTTWSNAMQAIVAMLQTSKKSWEGGGCQVLLHTAT